MNFHEQALVHSGVCLALLNEGRLKEALQYCTAHQIALPQYAHTVELEYKALCADAGIYQLGDYGWWFKRLKISAKRELEKHKQD